MLTYAPEGTKIHSRIPVREVQLPEVLHGLPRVYPPRRGLSSLRIRVATSGIRHRGHRQATTVRTGQALPTTGAQALTAPLVLTGHRKEVRVTSSEVQRRAGAVHPATTEAIPHLHGVTARPVQGVHVVP